MFSGIGPIIEQIWALPWYKIVIIAAIDDIIVMLKMWPLYVALLIIIISIVIIASTLKHKRGIG